MYSEVASVKYSQSKHTPYLTTITFLVGLTSRGYSLQRGGETLCRQSAHQRALALPAAAFLNFRIVLRQTLLVRAHGGQPQDCNHGFISATSAFTGYDARGNIVPDCRSASPPEMVFAVRPRFAVADIFIATNLAPGG